MALHFVYVAPAYQVVPISIGTPSTGTSSTGGQTLTFSHTVAEGSKRVLIVGAAAVDGSSSNFPVTGVTYGGVAMTLVDSRTATGVAQDVTASLWILVNPAVGTADVVATLNSSVVGRVGIACVFYNVDSSTPQDAAATGAGSYANTSSSINISTTTPNALGVDLVVTRTLQTHLVGASPQAMLQTETTTGGEDCTLSMSTELMATPGALTMSRSWTDSRTLAHSMMVLRNTTT